MSKKNTTHEKKNKSKKKEKDNDLDVKIQDAENFYYHLKERIGDGTNEGRRIEMYLEAVVPKWKRMKPNRLYQHMQSTLDRAEEIRKFEIELIWKRAGYLATLLLPFFTMFGYLAYEWKVTSLLKEPNDEVLKYLILTGLVFINFCFSSFSFIVSLEGHKWQRHWEHHVDYLQEILGVRLMRLRLRDESEVSLRDAHNVILLIIIFIWFFILMALLEGVLLSSYSGTVTNFMVAVSFLFFVSFVIFFSVTLSAIFVYFVPYLKRLCFLKSSLNKNIFMHPLENFDFDRLENETRWDKLKKYIAPSLIVIFTIATMFIIR